MGVGVRADLVALGCGPFYQVDAFALDAAAHGEERGFRAVVPQHVEHLGGGAMPGAVVERERDHLLVPDVGRHVAARDVLGFACRDFCDDAGNLARFDLAQPVGALPFEQMDGPAAFRGDRIGDGLFHDV